MEKEFEFKLSSPVSYHDGGEQVETCSLTLKAPSNKQRGYCAKLQQSFLKAVMGVQKENEGSKASSSKSNENISASDIYNLLLMSDCDMSEILDTFENMILSGDVCLLDGKTEIKRNSWDKISVADTNKLFGEYMSHFLVSSLMS
jgi:hypothetical protein